MQVLSNPGCSLPAWYSKPTLAGRVAALPSLQAAGGPQALLAGQSFLGWLCCLGRR